MLELIIQLIILIIVICVFILGILLYISSTLLDDPDYSHKNRR